MPGAPIESKDTPVRGDGNILEVHERTHASPASQEPSRGRHLDDALVACICHVHVAPTVDRYRNRLPQPESARSSTTYHAEGPSRRRKRRHDVTDGIGHVHTLAAVHCHALRIPGRIRSPHWPTAWREDLDPLTVGVRPIDPASANCHIRGGVQVTAAGTSRPPCCEELPCWSNHVDPVVDSISNIDDARVIDRETGQDIPLMQ